MQNLSQIIRSIKPIKLVLLVALLGILLGYTLPWVLTNSSGREFSGIDFHGYWYAGHYTRFGVNPYWAILDKNPYPVYWDPRFPGSGVPYEVEGEEGGVESDLELPLRYLDGRMVTEYPVAQVMIVAPSATAPLTLFMGLFSWLSWPTARTLWLGLNILFALLIPWLGFRLLENYREISRIDQLLLALAFYNFYGLRQCLAVGQQSIISLFVLMLALLFRDRWLLAGILLGFGISKYSVGLPLFLLFLLQKRWRSVIVALLVQLAGVLLLLPLSHGSLLETASAYLKVLDLSYSQEGIHLLARFPGSPLPGYLLAVVILLVLGYLVKTIYLRPTTRTVENNTLQLNMLSLLVIGIFLAVYHRIHDLPFAIFFFLPLMAIGAAELKTRPTELALITAGQWILIGLLIFPTIPGKLISYLGIPAETISAFASENAISTLVMLLMFLMSAWVQLKVFTESRQLNVKSSLA